MRPAHKAVWLLISLLKFLLGLWLSRRPNVMDNVLRIIAGLADRKRGVPC